MLNRLSGLVPAQLPRLIRISALFYLLHLFCLPKVAPAEIALLIALVALGLAWKKGEVSPTYHDAYAALALYVLASYTSALAAPDVFASIRQASDVAPMLVFPLALTLFRAHERLTDSALKVILTMAVLQAVVGLVQYVQSGGPVLERRILGVMSHVMSFAGLLLPASLLALIWAIEKRQWIAGVVGATCVVALGLSLTRSAWIGWVAGFGLYLLMRRRRWLAVIIPVGILVVTLSPLSIFGRLASSFDPTKSSNLDRIRMAQAGVEMIRDHPLLGMGPGNIKPSYSIYRLPDAPRFSVPHLHSNPIQIWAERGVVALFGYALFIVIVLRDCLRTARAGGDEAPWGLAAAAAVVGLTVAGLFEYNFGDSEVLMHQLSISALVCFKAERSGMTEPASP